MSQHKVLIVGASIAGPMTAYWFAKAGASVTIIERFPQLRLNGQNVDIRTVGVTVMRKIPGMEEAVRAKTLPYEGFSFVHSDGRPFGTIKPTGNADKQSLVSEYEIFRGDLSRVLYDMTKDNKNIRYVFNEQVASIKRTEGEDEAVTVEFANGLPSAEYDLVVACDGATSRTRAIGLGCGVRDHIKPINCWAAGFTIEKAILPDLKMGQAYSAPGGRFIAIGSDSPSSSKISLLGINRSDDADAMPPFRRAQNQGDAALKEFISQHYKGAGWKTEEILKEMMMSKDFYANEIMQVKPPTLHKGRFVLVGDSGYAPGPTGAGTSLAMVGGYVLAGEYLRNGRDISAALKAYEAQMRPIIDDLQKIPPLIPGVLAPQTEWGIWLRNQIFAFISWSRMMEIVPRFFISSFNSGDKYALRDYEWPGKEA
ncbi:unnamed protein product [Clonostachys byssicola]|uniref:FAD-binding domain-containing protein n=1 Tax=Clonostachys byssicola TaxID=160290 RepID=A0A9N9Y0X1_9HYPO|nr:unnamed protein product [Clonostachys byssicola]